MWQGSSGAPAAYAPREGGPREGGPSEGGLGEGGLGEGGLGEGGPDLSEAALDALLRHPQFDAAMLAAATATVEQYRGHWALNRLVNDRGRFILGLMILDLHFAAGGGAGFTAAGLRAAATAYGVSSPGRTTALLASLRLLGFLQPVPAEDRREQRLAPTERFLALHRNRWERHFQALALLYPQAEAARRALDRPACLGALAHALVNTYRQGLRLVRFVPALRAAAERDAGVTVLFSLLTAQAVGQTVSIAALARRFSVSRAHILTILREAEALGLAEPAGLRGGYAAGPALRTTLRRFFAVLFQLQQHAIAAAQVSQA